jgi:hypothetical protein
MWVVGFGVFVMDVNLLKHERLNFACSNLKTFVATIPPKVIVYEGVGGVAVA